MAWPLLPWVIGSAAAALGLTGVKKGFDAKEYYDCAKEIGVSSEKKYYRAIDSLNTNKNKVNKSLEDFGSFKLDVFNNQIRHLVDVLKKSKKASANLSDYDVQFTEEEVNELDQAVIKSLEIHNGIASGAFVGALAGWGAYELLGFSQLHRNWNRNKYSFRCCSD